MARRNRSKRTNRRWRRLPLAIATIAAAGLGYASTSAYTASNTVPTTNVGQYTHGIGPNDLKPAACASLTLGHLILGTTAGGSGSGDDLVLGTSGVDNVVENGPTTHGNCIIGGTGSDRVTAIKNGNDICIVNAGSTNKNCASTIIQP